MLQAKVDLEPHIISPRTHFSPSLGFVIHFNLFLFSDLQGIKMVSFQANFHIQIQETNKQKPISFHSIIFFKKLHCMPLALTGYCAYPCKIFMAQGMQCIDWLKLSHTHIWKQGWNKLSSAPGLVVWDRMRKIGLLLVEL